MDSGYMSCNMMQIKIDLDYMAYKMIWFKMDSDRMVCNSGRFQSVWI